MGELTVLLVDDHPVVRDGYRRLLESSGFDVVEADSGEEGYRRYCTQAPDVVVMDLNMPGIGGFEALRRILGRDSDAKVLVFSVHDNEAMLNQALKAGVRGYLTKRSAAGEMVAAVRTIAAGQVYIDRDLRHLVPDRRGSDTDNPLERLTPREFEVFRLLADGRSVAEIAETLSISPKTAGVHQTHIMHKLDAKNPVQLLRIAIRHGVIVV